MKMKLKVKVMNGIVRSSIDIEITLQEPRDGRGTQGDGQVPGHPSPGAQGRGDRRQRGELRKAELLLRVRSSRVSVGDRGVQESPKVLGN